MLTAYETAVQQLIQLVPSGLIPTGTLDAYINTARNQLAADAECIRAPASLVFTPSQQSYSITALVTSGTGISGSAAFTVRTAVSPNVSAIEIRSWEWFAAYYLPLPASGTPTLMAQQGQGTATTLYFWPTPNSAAGVVFDVACLPIPLVNDSTPEAIPGLWTDAVPFYAAWLAFQQLQRQADAQLMLARYKELAQRGRETATPSVWPDNLPGGAGARIAAQKTTLTMQPQQQAAG